MIWTLRGLLVIAIVVFVVFFLGRWSGYDQRDAELSSPLLQQKELTRRLIAADEAIEYERTRAKRVEDFFAKVAACSVVGVFAVSLVFVSSLVGWARLMRLTEPRVTVEGRMAEHYYKLPPAMDIVQIDAHKLKRLPAANVALMRDLLEKSVEKFGSDTARIMPSDQFGGYAKWKVAIGAIESITPIARTKSGGIPKSGATLTERKASDLLAMLDEGEDE